jgi:D-glycero-alpha-D-manno-heptose-7-phosphate kinase
MIISRTPLRVSFVGGGTDLPAFYSREPGAVVSTAITKYIYIAVNRKFDERIRASYSRTEIVDTVDELEHELIREALRLVGIDGAIEITSISDIPSRGTGLGSSSAYTVGLLNALHAHAGRLPGAERLAREACEIEMGRCGHPIGKQDQYIAAYGGLKYIRFNPDDSVVDPIICAPDTLAHLQRRLLLLYTGVTRRAGDVLSEQTHNTETDESKRVDLRQMAALAQQLYEALIRSDANGFGEVLHAGWLYKRSLASGITNSHIDEWYETARMHGAIGGKILGAGGGGFLLLYAPVERHQEICRTLPELSRVPFRFAPQGSTLVHVEENQDAYGFELNEAER